MVRNSDRMAKPQIDAVENYELKASAPPASISIFLLLITWSFKYEDLTLEALAVT